MAGPIVLHITVLRTTAYIGRSGIAANSVIYSRGGISFPVVIWPIIRSNLNNLIKVIFVIAGIPRVMTIDHHAYINPDAGVRYYLPGVVHYQTTEGGAFGAHCNTPNRPSVGSMPDHTYFEGAEGSLYGSLNYPKLLLAGMDSARNHAYYRHGIFLNGSMGTNWFGDNGGSTYEYYHAPY